MRLIDADKLLERVDKEREYLVARGQLGAEYILVKNFRDLIEEAPTVEPERPKGDLISRQDAIDALEEQLDYLQMLNKNENPTAEGKWYGVNWARNTIADLPYKQNERPKGEWLRDKNGFYCSGCGARAAKDNYLMELRTNFCPDCGIDLRGKVE